MVQMGLQQLFYVYVLLFPFFLLIFILELWEAYSMKRKKKQKTTLTDQLTTTKKAMLNVGIFYNTHSIILI